MSFSNVQVSSLYLESNEICIIHCVKFPAELLINEAIYWYFELPIKMKKIVQNKNIKLQAKKQKNKHKSTNYLTT